MSKLTKRDKVWDRALRVSEVGRSFRVRTVVGELNKEGENISRRTVKDTLESMAELGHIEHGFTSNRYKKTERD